MVQVTRVSYCTTCKGRLHHVSKTLIANLAAEQNNANIEFLLLDYDSNDGLGDWVKDNLSAEIASGRVVYARHEPAPHFRMAHAKNLAHRVATGDILVNVDGDNFIARDFSEWLRTCFSKDPNSLASPRDASVTGFFRQRYVNKVLGLPRPVGGLSGRIAISRTTFHALGGYDERYSAWGSDDLDMMLRARDSGARLVVMPSQVWGSAIDHDAGSKIEHMSTEDQKTGRGNIGRSPLKEITTRVAMITRKHQPVANAGQNFGGGSISMNWNEAQDLTSYQPSS